MGFFGQICNIAGGNGLDCPSASSANLRNRSIRDRERESAIYYLKIGIFTALTIFFSKHIITNFLKSSIILGHDEVCLFIAYFIDELSVWNVTILSRRYSPIP